MGYSGRGIISTIKLKAAIRLQSVPTHKILVTAGSRCQKQKYVTYLLKQISDILCSKYWQNICQSKINFCQFSNLHVWFRGTGLLAEGVALSRFYRGHCSAFPSQKWVSYPPLPPAFLPKKTPKSPELQDNSGSERIG